jgi:hypothetical protein
MECESPARKRSASAEKESFLKNFGDASKVSKSNVRFSSAL